MARFLQLILMSAVLTTYVSGAQVNAQPVDAIAEAGPTIEEANQAAQKAEGLYASGHYSGALPFAERALSSRESLLGQDDPTSLNSRNRLGLLLVKLGRYSEAEQLLISGLSSSETALGPDHVETLTFVSTLAELHLKQGAPGEAEPLFRRAFYGRQRGLGVEHPETISAETFLGQVYGALGRYSEAEPLLRHAVKVSGQVLGPNHSASMAALHALGALLYAQGRAEDAEPLLVRAFEDRARNLGDNHPDTLATMDKLADPYWERGRYSEAEALLKRTLEGRERALGPDHPETLFSLNNLGLFYWTRERLDEAEVLYNRALEKHERVLGPNHPETLIVLNNLATLYASQDIPQKAELFLRRVLERSEAVRGREHPFTLTAANNLGYLLGSQGRVAEALTLLTRVQDGRERVLGVDHPLTLLTFQTSLILATEMEELWADSLNVAGRFLAGVQLRRQRGGTAGGGPSKSMSEHSETAARFALYADVVWNATATDFMEREKVLPKVFEALQDSIAGPADRAVAEQAALRYAEGRDPALLKLIREKRRNQDEWSALDKTLGQALSGSAIVLEQVSAIRRQMQILQSRNAAIDKQLQTQAPEYLTLVEPRSVDVEAARALMGPEEALLLVRPSHFGTHLLLVTRDELTWHRSDWNISKIEGTVHWLRWDVGAQVSLPGEMLAALQLEKGDETQAFDRTAAYHLYQQIIEPILPRLAGKKMLFVASGGPLAGLPFSLLVAAPPAGSDENPADLRATQWFGDAFELGHITSIRSLATLRERPRPAVSGSAFIGVGDPALAQVGEARSYRALRGLPPLAEVFLNSESDARPHADVSQLRKMPSLPGTAVELRRVGERLAAPASSLYMQQRATENIVRSLNFSGTRVVLFSTHALTSDESGPLGEPGLVLTPPPPVQRSAAEEPEDIDPANDGYLAASEVAALEMETEWVVLSACNTATGDENTNLSALARAFFYAGAGSILASHWPVSDDVAPVLIAEAVAPKNSKLTRGQALQSAMRDIRMNPENSEWAHPFFWAPFVLLGDSAQSQWSENRGD